MHTASPMQEIVHIKKREHSYNVSTSVFRHCHAAVSHVTGKKYIASRPSKHLCTLLYKYYVTRQ